MIAHQLAEERGWINVDAMLDEIDPGQFMELIAYRNLKAKQLEEAEQPKRELTREELFKRVRESRGRNR